MTFNLAMLETLGDEQVLQAGRLATCGNCASAHSQGFGPLCFGVVHAKGVMS